jgi:hypothetical protein
MTEIKCIRCRLSVTAIFALPQSTPINHPADYAEITAASDWPRLCVDESHAGVLIACPHMRGAIKSAFEAGRF